jgi:hypothetical protein
MSLTPAQKKKLADHFFCKFLNRDVKMHECIDDYVNANSLNVRHSPCFKCPQGLKTRIAFSAG